MIANGLISPGIGLIFDLDGVIVHSTPLHNRAWADYLAPFGIPPDEVQTKMHGLRNDDIVRNFFGHELEPVVLAAHGSAKEALFRDLMAPELERWLVPGMRAFLGSLDGVPVGLASNAEPANIDFILDGADIRGFFGAVVDGHQVARPKPFPDIYLKTAEILGVDPRNCVIFEDSLAGVEAALGAGSRVVGLTTTLEHLPGVHLAVPDFTDRRLGAWLSQQAPLP